MEYAAELAAARDAAARASALLAAMYARGERMTDAPMSISTDADRASQEAVLQALRERFPADAYRAEEDTPTLATSRRDGERVWIVDPIDGTRGFVEQTGEFSVMIALAVRGEVVVGVVAEPAVGQVCYATKGGGCFRERDGVAERVRVSGQHELSAATLVQSHSKRGPSAAVQRLRPAAVLEMYSAGVKLARVACGDADYYLCDYSALNDWDVAAGHILVEEAGGRMTLLSGDPLRYATATGKHLGGILASNGALHDAALKSFGDASQVRPDAPPVRL